ncbi:MULTISPECIES: ABC transporter ATP-binding protein [unclassified Sphingomonas]|uniref:ABC transporter ATP-binding protein n=1 Tax=unclassified Sphingomonas TaxID=196159 RepID=UPI002269DE3F|nr:MULTISPECIES: ABC transporter ATP-binding protein [unclassified Sphingomonas]
MELTGGELRIEALGVTLGRRPVLHDVSAILRPGRLTAILGPNGAGKSTLVKAAAALIPAAAGRVRIGDEDVARLDPRDRARRIGYLPQEATVHWNVAARDVVALGRLPYRSPHAAPSTDDRAAVERAMADTVTLSLADRPVNELSGGERARVLLARVLAGRPRWLLVDEPLASLDPAHRFDLVDRLKAAAAEGAGVAMVLHDLMLAASAADDVLLLQDGRIAAFGPAAEVLTPARLAAVFGVRVVPVMIEGRPIGIPVARLDR